jgi:hypothetical protein
MPGWVQFYMTARLTLCAAAPAERQLVAVQRRAMLPAGSSSSSATAVQVNGTLIAAFWLSAADSAHNGNGLSVSS